MRTIKGPAIFLAQFAGDKPPFNSLASIGRWAAGLGFVGVQIPTWDGRLFELAKAACKKAWLTFAASRTEADFKALRDHVEWTRRKHGSTDNSESVPIRK